MKIKGEVVTGIIVDERMTYSLMEICSSCGVHAECIMEWVEYGIIEPKGKRPSEWQFSADALQRSQKALRLQRDLELNLAGLALALELLDEIETLRLKSTL